jgi:orotidine-5'-phosphate decarboxylase
MLAKDRIIVALDVDHPSKAIDLVTKLKSTVGSFKIGLELITAMLASMLVESELEAFVNVKSIRKLFRLLGRQLFWDGKFDDIPNTVGAASKIVGETIHVGIFNVHASSSIASMMAAVAGKGDSQVLAVTVLTSYEENNAFLDFGAPSKARVLEFARHAKLAGCDGVICSPLELVLLDSQPELAGFQKVTPGIRSPEDPADDQKRTLSPYEAILAGAGKLVIGRPITNAASPVQAVEKITEGIRLGLVHRMHMSLFNLQKIKFGTFRLKLHEKNPDAPLSPIYLDIRKLPDWLYSLMGDVLHDLSVKENIGDFDYVIGIPKAGEPIGQAFAKAVGKPHLRIEKVESDEGRRITSTILDPFEKGRRVVLVDDLVTKAGTKREAIEAIEANGLKVIATLVLYDREQGGLAELNASGRKVCAAARLSETLEFFEVKGKINAAKKQQVLDYIAAN